MNRRIFFRTSALAAGVLLSKKPAALMLNSRPEANFSLDVVTDDPDTAIREIERFLQHYSPRASQLSFSEYPLQGKHVGNLVFIKNGTLRNIWTQNDSVARQLREIAGRLRLPQVLTNPSLLQFSTLHHLQRPQTVAVFANQLCVARLPLQRETERRFGSDFGWITLQIRDGAAHIIDASCRHRTCAKMWPIRQPGQHLVCIPSRLRVSVEGAAATGVDGVVS